MRGQHVKVGGGRCSTGQRGEIDGWVDACVEGVAPTPRVPCVPRSQMQGYGGTEAQDCRKCGCTDHPAQQSRNASGLGLATGSAERQREATDALHAAMRALHWLGVRRGGGWTSDHARR